MKDILYPFEPDFLRSLDQIEALTVTASGPSGSSCSTRPWTVGIIQRNYEAELESMSYEDYLAAVEKQKQRDRDRFVGVDSHDDEDWYDANTGIARDRY